MGELAPVVIVGAGAAGLTTALLLRSAGIGCTVLERQSRDYVEQRQRAGVVEYRAARMYEEWGLGALLGQFPADSTLIVRVEGRDYPLGCDELSKRCPGRLTPQRALVSSMIADFAGNGGDLRFEAAAVSLRDLGTSEPVVAYTDAGGGRHEITASFVAGCDGDHGICRQFIPPAAMTVLTRDFGITWLTVLASAPPPRHPLLAASRDGFAAHFARGPGASRLYLQVAADDTVADWPDERVWEHLRTRLHDDALVAGPITEREMFALRGRVCEPMSYGRLYLLGDAAHIVPPMGGKGMNLAVYDAEIFAKAIRDYARDGTETSLASYSATCLRRVWAYQDFAGSLTDLLHHAADPAHPYQARLAMARLDRALSAETASRDFAELLAGLG